MPRWRAIAVVAACGAIGCRVHWTAEVTQPMPSVRPEQGAQQSLPLTIESRAMPQSIETRGLVRWARLANTAYYVVVSRDRLRFHLTLRHTWEEMSDLRTWDAWVEDEHGVRHDLEEIDQKLAMIGPSRAAIYRGTVAFTVYGRDLLAACHRITLVMRRPRYEYRYVWNSADDPGEPRGEPLPPRDEPRGGAPGGAPAMLR
jgi:hypothetical protein